MIIIRSWTSLQAVEENQHVLVGCSARGYLWCNRSLVSFKSTVQFIKTILMEVRRQDKEIGMPYSMSFNPSNGDSSSKILSSTAIISIFQDRRGKDLQNLDNHHHHLYQHPQVNLQHQIIQPARDSEPIIPDPTPIASKSATNTAAPIPTSRSTSRSFPPASTIITTSSTPSVRYRECLKNHAASMGGFVVDGCGEFMPSGEEGTAEALKCAACECHRNFHRKEIDRESQFAANCYHKNNSQRNSTLPIPQLPPPQPSVHQHHHRYHRGFSTTAPMMMNFGGSGGAPAESSSEDLNMFPSNLQVQGSMERLKKRFRTKFNQEQKDKMMEFAEKLGWKIQKQDEQEVQQFCSKVGVKRKVFKVWMHNNKQAMKEKPV